jgi:hypothetical protein
MPHRRNRYREFALAKIGFEDRLWDKLTNFKRR